jgi:hypothetical protein
MPSEDIRDLLGRYATGTLSETERQRLFDAALDDQELFEELARELQLKQLLDEPGARDRMIRALEPPRRRRWILVLAPIAASLAILLAILMMRPAPKPVQIAAIESVNQPKPAEPVNQPKPPAEPEPVVSPVRMKQEVAPQPPAAAPQPEERKAKDAAKKADAVESASAVDGDTVQLDEKKVAAPAPAAAPIQQRALDQQAPGGPKQSALQNARQAAGRAFGGTAGSTILPSFGFHYSVATKGHLIIVPLADGYLSIKTNDGAILAAQKPIAAAITIDIPVPDAATSVAVVFKTTATAAEAPAVSRDAAEATVQGATVAAVTIQLKK